MAFLRTLKLNVQGWLLVKAVSWGFDNLESKHVGKLLNEATDKKFGSSMIDPVQKRIAQWLRQVALELEG